MKKITLKKLSVLFLSLVLACGVTVTTNFNEKNVDAASKSKTYYGVLSKKKGKGKITKVKVYKSKFKITGSLRRVKKNKHGNANARKTRTYKKSKKFKLYLKDADGSFKLPKNRHQYWLNKVRRSNTGLYIHMKGNTINKMYIIEK